MENQNMNMPHCMWKKLSINIQTEMHQFHKETRGKKTLFKRKNFSAFKSNIMKLKI